MPAIWRVVILFGLYVVTAFVARAKYDAAQKHKRTSWIIDAKGVTFNIIINDHSPHHMVVLIDSHRGDSTSSSFSSTS